MPVRTATAIMERIALVKQKCISKEFQKDEDKGLIRY